MIKILMDLRYLGSVKGPCAVGYSFLKALVFQVGGSKFDAFQFRV